MAGIQHLKIADTGVAVANWQLNGNFTSFEISGIEAADIHVELVWGGMPGFLQNLAPATVASGQLLYSQQGTYYIEYLGEGCINGMSFSDDYSACTVFANRAEYDKLEEKEAVVDKNVGVAMRRCLIGRLSLEDGLIIHSAGIAWHKRGIAFSAASGTGKSTQAELWRKWRGAEIIDGDNCAIRYCDGQPLLYGLPWCGSSNIFKNTCVPLASIVFLEQAGENTVAELPPHEQVIRLTSRCFLPMWDKNNPVDRCISIAEKIASRTRLCLLKCRPDYDAVELLTRWLG